MPTIFTHAAVPLALGLGLERRTIPKRLLVCGVFAAMLPDLDVIAFRLGIPYAAEFGHRGFSHSLLLAALLALLAACCCRALQARFSTVLWFVFFATASHGLLDMFTNGGMGIAWFWPWDKHRYFAPVQVIQVSPLKLERVFSAQGLAVLRSELQWVWVPALASMSLLIALRRLWAWLRPSNEESAKRHHLL